MKTFAQQIESALVETITEMLAEEALAENAPLQKRHVTALMKKHGIEGTVGGKGHDWNVELPNETHMKKFTKHVAKVGGFKNGWGGWNLSPGHKSKGDWNDKSSAHHY